MSFTYNLSASGTALVTSKLRLALGDNIQGTGVLPTGGNFSDEELQVFLNDEGLDINRGVAATCEALALHYARAVDTTSGPLRQALSQAAARYTALAQSLRQSYGGGGAVAFAGRFVRADGYAYNAGSVDVTQ